MRIFPCAARSRLAATAVAGVVSLGLLTTPFALADDHHGGRSSSGGNGTSSQGELKHRQGSVEHQIHATSADLEDASHAIIKATRAVASTRARLQHARGHLDDVRTRLDQARDKASGLHADLEASRADLAKADQALADGRKAVVQQRARVKRTVLDAVTGGDTSLDAVASLVTAGSLSDITRIETTQQIASANSDQVYDDLTAAQADLTTQQADVEAATHRVADRSQTAARQLVQVRELFAEAHVAKQDVVALVARSVEARQHAVAVRQHDRQVLARLRHREAFIKHKILRLARIEARKAARAGHSTGVTGASDGFLTYPAAGYPVTSPYGYRIHPIYGYYSLHNGDDFGVPCGTPLHAAAGGTVISSYYDAVWGNRVFLSLGSVNGHNMTVVYNHLTKPLVTVGQHVARGEIVGLSGTTGWSTGCHLHFTVLVDGVAVDPMTYL